MLYDLRFGRRAAVSESEAETLSETHHCFLYTRSKISQSETKPETHYCFLYTRSKITELESESESGREEEAEIRNKN
jgi:hypothetical protein